MLCRREFFLVGAFGAAVSPYASAAASNVELRRPNVLLIICDGLNDTVEGLGGHPQARTPNISRLMKAGVCFRNAQVNAPICAPSRASLWTGLYPHTTGYYGYEQQKNHWRHFPKLRDAKTMMEHFRDHQYLVGGTGLVFHTFHEDDSVWSVQGTISGKGFPSTFGPAPWDGRMPCKPRPESGHSAMPDPYNRRFWQSFGPLSDIPVTPPDPQRGIPGYRGWVLYGKPFPYQNDRQRGLMPDELNARWAATRLKRPHKRPFFMVVGMTRPHIPLYAPKMYFDMFPLQMIQLPPRKENDLEDCARILWRLPGTGERTMLARELSELLEVGGERLWRRWVQSYLACVAFVDDQIGTILDSLEEGPNARNTIVVITSDHGYHMGEKDHIQKLTPWEEVAKVPLVIAGPGVPAKGRTCDQPVSLVDLYPTLVDLCGLPDNPNQGGNGLPLDGHSLRPLFQRPERGTWRGPPVALTCLNGPVRLRRGQAGRPEDQHFTVRSRTHRYILCSNGEEELYDHRSDPHEWHNLARDPKHAEVKRRLRNELLRMTGRSRRRE